MLQVIVAIAIFIKSQFFFSFSFAYSPIRCVTSAYWNISKSSFAYYGMLKSSSLRLLSAHPWADRTFTIRTAWKRSPFEQRINSKNILKMDNSPAFNYFGIFCFSFVFFRSIEISSFKYKQYILKRTICALHSTSVFGIGLCVYIIIHRFWLIFQFRFSFSIFFLVCLLCVHLSLFIFKLYGIEREKKSTHTRTHTHTIFKRI